MYNITAWIDDICTKEDLDYEPNKNEMIIGLDSNADVDNTVDFVMNKKLFLDEYDLRREVRECLVNEFCAEEIKNNEKAWMIVRWDYNSEFLENDEESELEEYEIEDEDGI